ncbi:MAG: endonuclease III [Deltaproteobacteria bacterium]|nr:endonuclease III [Deltaproteobacteria bacterium]
MRQSDMAAAIKILKKESIRFETPYLTEVAGEGKDPFRVLVSCVLSLRTKDSTTRAASTRLFEKAKTPAGLSSLAVGVIEKAIYPVGFYRVKARRLRQIANELISRHYSRVPDTMEGLLSLKGVGRKTANLVLTMGYNKPGICVDTHVHRIANRWGYVKTKTPEETEFALRRKLLRRYWIVLNDLLVTFGQNVCRPISPFCSGCRLFRFCARAGVERAR